MKTVDVVVATPSILQSHHPEDYPNLKVVATAGEPCPRSLADRWSVTALFYNCCGPTEVCAPSTNLYHTSTRLYSAQQVTIVNTMHLHQPGSPITIGRPTPNNSVYVLDEFLHPVPLGEVGVMWAGGSGISLGYLNRPDLTNTRYKNDPFCSSGYVAIKSYSSRLTYRLFRGMMFNTGDLGRVREDGAIEHFGRIDDQVKVKVIAKGPNILNTL